MAIVDLFMLYQFLRRLVQPFNKWNAYKDGVIDRNGEILVKPSDRSLKQKDSFGKFDLLVLRLKKLLEKIPGGKSRFASFAAALLLIKEHNNIETTQHISLTESTDEELVEKLIRTIDYMEEEGAPVNNVGGGNIAGAGPEDTPPVKKNRRFRIVRRRKKKANNHVITT